MGVVYKAQDDRLERTVALKFLPEHLLGDPSAKARFILEAKGASAINHPNITTVYDIDEADGRSFIAMEYIEGQTLRELVRENLKLGRVLEIGVQIMEGLDAAHKKGIVHRDIKSENIMVTNEGVVKIMDFGLAKLKGAARLTGTGTTLGTVGYMSPEQSRGETADHRSDLFSAGVVLYELITGRLPFYGEHPAAVVYSIYYEEPEPLARFKAGVPEGLQRVIDKALKKDKNVRYQSGAELLADLKSLQQDIRAEVSATVSRRIMLAVLPFQNLGPSEDEYFADGVTDEITANLAKIDRLGVISRTSAVKYRKTDKVTRQIGSELGVDYILEGTVRWEKDSSRVRINSQLIMVRDDTLLWADRYDRILGQIFDVQSDIAGNVVKALQIALLEPEKRFLETKATGNLEAYDYYLRGNDYLNRGWGEEKELRIAQEMYEKALSLDAGFALACVMLARVHLFMYWLYHDRTKERLARAKEVLERLFRLRPDLPEAHLALGFYYYWGHLDYERALEQFALAQKGRPNDSELLFAIAAVQRRQGRWEPAVANLKLAARLDPHSRAIVFSTGSTCQFMRDYPQAERFFDRAIALAPDWPPVWSCKASLYLSWTGDTKRARKVLEEASTKTGTAELAVPWAQLEILDGDYRAALGRLGEVEQFVDVLGKNDRAAYFLAKAKIYDLMNQLDLKRGCCESARALLEAHLKERPEDPRFHGQLGLTYAGLGRKEEAVRHGKKAVALLPVSKDAVGGPDWLENLARIYVLTGEYEAAIEELEVLLSLPSFLSPSLLRIDPAWAPLRNHPRFQTLLVTAPPVPSP